MPETRFTRFDGNPGEGVLLAAGLRLGAGQLWDAPARIAALAVGRGGSVIAPQREMLSLNQSRASAVR